MTKIVLGLESVCQICFSPITTLYYDSTLDNLAHVVWQSE